MDLHGAHISMFFEWKPDQTMLEQIAQRIGLIDSAYDDDALGDFVMYWLGQPMRKHTNYQWTHKFVQNLKYKRTAFRPQTTKVVGSQIVPNTAALDIDSNSKDLINRYGNNARR